jgi:hypothetical protein
LGYSTGGLTGKKPVDYRRGKDRKCGWTSAGYRFVPAGPPALGFLSKANAPKTRARGAQAKNPPPRAIWIGTNRETLRIPVEARPSPRRGSERKQSGGAEMKERRSYKLDRCAVNTAKNRMEVDRTVRCQLLACPKGAILPRLKRVYGFWQGNPALGQTAFFPQPSTAS